MTSVEDELVGAIARFVKQDVLPVASRLEHADEYPHALVERMQAMGLFGAIIAPEHAGLGLDLVTYARVVEELCIGWMSLSGVLNTHLLVARAIAEHGTAEQKRRYLARMASGEHRGALCLTEPEGGSDVANLRCRAVRDGESFRVTGSKAFITNARTATLLLVAVRTDAAAEPPYRGLSLLLCEKGPGLSVGRNVEKLGYKGVETCDVAFDGLLVPSENLLGGAPGRGFGQVMSVLEVGRINVAARAVGVARAAFEHALAYARERETFGRPIAEHQAIQLKLADMATKIAAARLLTHDAARRRDRGERSDLEAGMAKLFASETCLEVATEAMRVLGGVGYTKDSPVERYFRDAPLMIIGEGTNEIQRLMIAKQLLARVT